MLKKTLVTLIITATLGLAPRANAKSFVSVLATVPDTIFHVVTIGTDTAEYVAGKVNYGFMEIDTVADNAVVYFHNVAHPTATVTAAKAARKAAKKAAKLKHANVQIDATGSAVASY